MQPLIHILNLDELCRYFSEESEIWAVDVERQQLHRLKNSTLHASTPISSSRFGFGNDEGSFCTPLGAHRVAEIYGKQGPIGQAFKNREPLGDPLPRFTGGIGDAILTRILWLDGLVPGLNDQSKTRYIYIHGTHQEELLGTPASQGCIRMGNVILAEWVKDLNHDKPLVWIGNIDYSPTASMQTLQNIQV